LDEKLRIKAIKNRMRFSEITILASLDIRRGTRKKEDGNRNFGII
jgi:hypothetical protein